MVNDRRFSELRRVEWVDYCKGIGIFLVVIGHTLAGLQPPRIISDSPGYRFIEAWLYTFHMPLFFFLSGLFVERSARRPLAGFISDKIAVLVYPYFVWSILQGLLETSHYVNHPLPAIALLKIPYVPIGQYWFLYTLFICMMLYALCDRIFRSDTAFIGLAIVCFGIEQSGWNIVQWEVAHAVGSFLIYFAAGVVVARGSPLVQLAMMANGWLLAICIGGYAAVTIGVATHSSHQAILWPGWAASGIIATVALAILMSRSTKFTVAKLWGILSLEIYLAHVIAAAIVRIGLQKMFNLSQPLVHFAIGTAIGIYAPIFLAYILPRVGFPYAFTLSRARAQPWARNTAVTMKRNRQVEHG